MAVTTLTTSMAGAVNYTATTASSSDWASVSNSTYFYDLTDKLVYYKNSSGTVLSIYSAGGLTYFTEAQSTTTPNDVVNVDSLTAVASTTNADISIVPKGAGAFLLAVPDNTTTGGNKRGTGAVDLQMLRTGVTRVASGNYSVVMGGKDNASTGNYSTTSGETNIASGVYSIGIGYSNTSSNTNTIALGFTNTASGQYSTAIGASNIANNTFSTALGYNNTSSGQSSFVAGQGNTASGQYSVAMGYNSIASNTNSVAIGRYCTASETCVAIGYNVTSSGIGSLSTGQSSNNFGTQGRHSHASTSLSGSGGDAQKSTFVLARRTTDATLTFLTTDGSGSISSSSLISLQNNNVFRFKGSIVGKQTSTTNVGVWDIDGVIVRGATAGTTTLTIANVNLVTNLGSWGTPTLTIDGSGFFRINVQGLAGTNIQWVALVETTECIY